MTVYFTSNGRKLVANDITGFHYADRYLWITIDAAVHMFNNIDDVFSGGGWLAAFDLTSHTDVSDLIKAQVCRMHEDASPENMGTGIL